MRQHLLPMGLEVRLNFPGFPGCQNRFFGPTRMGQEGGQHVHKFHGGKHRLQGVALVHLLVKEAAEIVVRKSGGGHFCPRQPGPPDVAAPVSLLGVQKPIHLLENVPIPGQKEDFLNAVVYNILVNPPAVAQAEDTAVDKPQLVGVGVGGKAVVHPCIYQSLINGAGNGGHIFPPPGPSGGVHIGIREGSEALLLCLPAVGMGVVPHLGIAQPLPQGLFHHPVQASVAFGAAILTGHKAPGKSPIAAGGEKFLNPGGTYIHIGNQDGGDPQLFQLPG